MNIGFIGLGIMGKPMAKIFCVRDIRFLCTIARRKAFRNSQPREPPHLPLHKSARSAA